MKNLKKIIGILLALALVVTSVTAGTMKAQAYDYDAWPYGTWKCTDEYLTNCRIAWQFATEVEDNYDECVMMYTGSFNKALETNDWMMFKKIAKNKYKSKKYKFDGTNDKFYCVIKRNGNKMTLYWYDYSKKKKKYIKSKTVNHYKRIKKLSHNVG